jgi:hypothetical protein
MRHSHHASGSTNAQAALMILAGWQPSHRSLEAEAAELLDLQERDSAARQTFAKGAAQ